MPELHGNDWVVLLLIVGGISILIAILFLYFDKE